MTITLLIILAALAIALIAKARRTWRELQAMRRAFDHKPAAPAEHDAWYIEQAIRDATIEQEWRNRVAINEQQRAFNKRQPARKSA